MKLIGKKKFSVLLVTASIFIPLGVGWIPRSAATEHERIETLVGRRASEVVHPDGCSLIDTKAEPPLEHGKLTRFWAQELMGADLAKESLREARGNQEVLTGVIDGGFYPQFLTGARSKHLSDLRKLTPLMNGSFNGHGTAVANLINGRGSIGMSEAAVLDMLLVSSDHLSDPKVRRFFSHSQAPRLINLSRSADDKFTLANPTVNALTKQSILVFAAGNSHPAPLDWATKRADAIIVGSLDSDGLVSEYSTEGDELTIAAPVGSGVVTRAGEKDSDLFSGTSAAAPLVTGALANLMSLLPSLKENSDVRTLLGRTAVKTPNAHQVPRKNGAGMVNALKLVEVGKRLKNANWPKLNKNLINDLALYDFSAEALVLFQQAKIKLKSPSCETKREGFKLLRKSFLLDQSEGARRLLSDLYRRMGFEKNAAFYDNLDPNHLGEMLFKKMDETAIASRKTALRMATVLGDGNRLLIEQGLRDSSSEVRVAALAATPFVKVGADAFIRQGLTDSQNSVRLMAARAAGSLRTEAAIPLLLIAMRDMDAEVRRGAAQMLGKHERRNFDLVKSALQDAHIPVREAAVVGLDVYHGNEVIPFLETLARDPTPQVRAAAITGLGKRGRLGIETLRALADHRPDIEELMERIAIFVSEEESGPLIEELSRSKDQKDRIAAARSAPYLSPQRGRRILETLLLDPNREVRETGQASLETLSTDEEALNLITPANERRLRERMNSPDPLVRRSAARDAVRWGKYGATYIAHALKDPDDEVRRYASQMNMGEHGIPLISLALEDQELDVRRYAVQSALRLESGAMPLLQKALRDRSVEVRLAVFYGYPPLPIILSGFRDPDFSVRIAAVNAIPSLMDDAIPALRELIRLPPPPSMASLWKNTVVRQISAVYELGIPLQSLGLPLRVYLRGYLDQEKPEGDELALVRRMLRDLN